MQDYGPIFQLLGLLKVGDLYSGNRFKPLPDEIRRSITWLCDQYLEGTPELRQAIRSRVKPEISFEFFMFARAKAEEAVRENSEPALLLGIAALAIENCTFDLRDGMSVLVTLVHSARKIGAYPDVFHRVTSIAGERPWIDNFLKRDAKSQEIGTFGFKEGINEQGQFAYVPRAAPNAPDRRRRHALGEQRLF